MKFWNWGPTTYLLPCHSPWPFPQESENCFFCDSRDQGGHGIENVIWSGGRGSNKTWWQAESGEGTRVPMCSGLGSWPGHADKPLWLQVLRMSPSSWT